MEEDRILVPATPGLIPLRLSVSKVKTFLDCKRKFEFTYIQKLPRKTQDYLILGTMTHKVLEDFHAFLLAGETEPFNVLMLKAFKNGIEDHKHELTPEIKANCRDLVTKYLKLITEQKANGTMPNVISVERRFEVELPGQITMNGAVDRYDLDPDGVIQVVDYKSSKSSKYLVKDPFQLMTYAYVALKDDPKLTKVRGTYLMLKLNFEKITFEFTKDEILKVEDKFMEYAEQIRAEKNYDPTPSFLCSYCDHLNLCPEGKAKSYNANIFGEVNW